MVLKAKQTITTWKNARATRELACFSLLLLFHVVCLEFIDNDQTVKLSVMKSGKNSAKIISLEFYTMDYWNEWNFHLKLLQIIYHVLCCAIFSHSSFWLLKENNNFFFHGCISEYPQRCNFYRNPSICSKVWLHCRHRKFCFLFLYVQK